MKELRWLYCVALLVAASSCADEGTATDGANSATARLPQSALPGLTSDTDCGKIPTTDFCTWALAADALVYGTIQDFNLVDSPAFLAKYPPEPLLDECAGPVNPAFEVLLRVDRVFHGQRHDNITFRVGPRQLDWFSPAPRRADDGSIEWRPASRALGKPLSIGQDVGVALVHLREHGYWTLSNNPMFEFVSTDAGDEVAVFQSLGSDCAQPPPEDFTGLTRAAITTKLAACGPEKEQAALSRRDRIVADSAEDPSYAFAAHCFGFEDMNPGEDCLDDTDCVLPETCIDGQCR